MRGSTDATATRIARSVARRARSPCRIATTVTATATRCEISIGTSYDTGELAVDDTSTAPWWWPVEPGAAVGTAPCTEYSACSANWVAATATTVRASVRRPPATVRHRSVEKAIESTTASRPGRRSATHGVRQCRDERGEGRDRRALRDTRPPRSHTGSLGDRRGLGYRRSASSPRTWDVISAADRRLETRNGPGLASGAVPRVVETQITAEA